MPLSFLYVDLHSMTYITCLLLSINLFREGPAAVCEATSRCIRVCFRHSRLELALANATFVCVSVGLLLCGNEVNTHARVVVNLMYLGAECKLDARLWQSL